DAAADDTVADAAADDTVAVVEDVVKESTFTLALSGQVSNEADLPITSGLTGTAKIGDLSVPVTFESDGSYSATFLSFIGPAAETGDTVEVSVTNAEGETITEQVVLSVAQILAQQASDVDVTGFAVSTLTLALSGKVSNEADLPVTSGLAGTAKIGDVSVPVTFESDGGYSATFFSFSGPVAVPGDTVEVSVTNAAAETIKREAVLSALQVATQRASDVDVTGFAVSTSTLVLSGKVSNVADLPVTSGLAAGTAKIGDLSVPVSFESDGSYSATFFSFSGSVAKTGDTVEVSVTNADGETLTAQLALSALQVATQQASDVDVTGFAVSTSTLALSGQVSNVADLPITSGLTGTAKIGDLSVPVTFESDGSY
ncbi:uncharacterized protein METZ01_LOCUS310222, partial [marine metagenome]